MIENSSTMLVTTFTSYNNEFCVFQRDPNNSQKPNQLSTYYSTQGMVNNNNKVLYSYLDKT